MQPRGTRRTRAFVRAVLAAAVLLAGIVAVGPSRAATDPADKCAGAKVKAAGKKTYDKAKCHQKAFLKGMDVDAACLAKAETKFSAAITKANAGGCPGTATGLEADVDACVGALVGGITGEARCAAVKVKAAGKKVYDKAKCHQKALLKATTVDAACLTKAEGKFSAAVAKADAAGACTGTAAELETNADACVVAFVAGVTLPCTVVATFGTLGVADGQFSSPAHVATDAVGNVYVADFANRRIQKFDASGGFLLKWGLYGTGDGQFHSPWGVATDTSGNVYVADFGEGGYDNHRVQKFNASGVFLTKWGSYCDVTYGTGCVDPDGGGPLELGDGQFIEPHAVATDASGNVYVADYNSRIQKFDAAGAFLLKWGSYGSGSGQFFFPEGVATDAIGNVYVTDHSQRIQKFDGSGTFLMQWGMDGTGDGQFRFPIGVATDASGNVYVADEDNNRIQKFNASATFLFAFSGSGTGQFSNPRGVATAGGSVYVVDSYNHRVQKLTCP